MTTPMYTKGTQGINYFYVCWDKIALQKAIYKRKLNLNIVSRVLEHIIYKKAQYDAIRYSDS